MTHEREGSLGRGHARNMNDPHRNLSLVVTLALGLLTACNATVQGGEGGSGSGSGGGGVGGLPEMDADDTSAPAGGPTTTTGGAPIQASATARWVTPALETELCGSGFPCDLPDGSILLVIDSAAPQCDTPIQRTWGSGDGYRIAIGLPPAMQIEGVYDLALSPDIVMTQGLESSGGGTVGGGPSGMGTLEILAIDDLSMTIRIEGMLQAWSTDDNGVETLVYDTDGQYVTAPCE